MYKVGNLGYVLIVSQVLLQVPPALTKPCYEHNTMYIGLDNMEEGTY